MVEPPLDPRPLSLSVGRLGVNTLMRVGVIILAAEFLKCLASSLGNEEGSKATEKHEKSIDLKNVVHPGSLIVLGSTTGTKDGDGALANDGSNLAGGGRDTVRGGSVAGGEDFTGDNEGGSVGT